MRDTYWHDVIGRVCNVVLKMGLKQLCFLQSVVDGFPLAEACHIAINEVCDFLNENKAITTVYFSCFSHEVETELRRGYREWQEKRVG